MEEQAMTGSAGYWRRATELIEVVASMHDQTIDDSITQDAQTTESSETLYSTAADCKWLRSYLHLTTYNIWHS